MLSFDNHSESVRAFIEYVASEDYGISEQMSENWS
jgi:hypothetical protein